jgi:hypothetical protein
VGLELTIAVAVAAALVVALAVVVVVSSHRRPHGLDLDAHRRATEDAIAASAAAADGWDAACRASAQPQSVRGVTAEVRVWTDRAPSTDGQHAAGPTTPTAHRPSRLIEETAAYTVDGSGVHRAERS